MSDMKNINKALGGNAKFYPNYLINHVASDFKFHLENGIKRIIDDNDRMVEEISELRGAFKEVKSIALQELEWRLEGSECGMCEVEEAKDRLEYKIDSLLARLQKGIVIT